MEGAYVILPLFAVIPAPNNALTGWRAQPRFHYVFSPSSVSFLNVPVQHMDTLRVGTGRLCSVGRSRALTRPEHFSQHHSQQLLAPFQVSPHWFSTVARGIYLACLKRAWNRHYIGKSWWWHERSSNKRTGEDISLVSLLCSSAFEMYSTSYCGKCTCLFIETYGEKKEDRPLPPRILRSQLCGQNNRGKEWGCEG